MLFSQNRIPVFKETFRLKKLKENKKEVNQIYLDEKNLDLEIGVFIQKKMFKYFYRASNFKGWD